MRREVDRVEHAPRRRNPIIPALLILLLLVAAGLAALWYFTRRNKSQSRMLRALRSTTPSRDYKTRASKPTSQAGRAKAGRDRHQPTATRRAGRRRRINRSRRLIQGPRDCHRAQRRRRDRDRRARPLAAAGLGVNVVKVFSDEPEGQVTAQNPGAGEKVATDTTVRLNVSKGTGEVDVPSLVGVSRDEAVSTLEAAGLRANVVTVPSAEPEGTVVAQNPTAGTTRAGSSVRLNFSSGTP